MITYCASSFKSNLELVLANLRCGAWYTDPTLVGLLISLNFSYLYRIFSTPQATNVPAYFKSTDGHFNNWSFNLRRSNLHLLPLIIEQCG